MQSASMAKDAAITVRVPVVLKRRLAQRAQRERRSVSAQVVFELERAVASEPDVPADGRRVLGMFAGARLPTDDDFLEVRAALWSRLRSRRRG
jgi:hypothetical protein